GFLRAARAILPKEKPQTLGGLTGRELEVAALVAQGRSNREIALALSVGERTVESHVGNILNKLGFNSRVQIAAWAAQQGLTKNLE
nr:helix-turn-helix transcriptional regulator [Deinococcota bacterium]